MSLHQPTRAHAFHPGVRGGAKLVYFELKKFSDRTKLFLPSDHLISKYPKLKLKVRGSLKSSKEFD